MNDSKRIAALALLAAFAFQAACAGGGAFIIPEPQAKAIGMEWSETFRGEGREFARSASTPQAFLGRYPLPPVAERVLIASRVSFIHAQLAGSDPQALDVRH